MKIGILTHWWGTDNYGQILQMYGLSSYLSSQGYNVIILRFNPFKIQQKRCISFRRLLNIFNPFKVFSHVINKVNSFKLKMSLKKTPSRNFDEFCKHHLSFSGKEYSSVDELETDISDYDAIIVGSDQVWNYFSGGESGFPVIDTYSIRFGKSNLIRLSYAASMGFSGTEKLHLTRLIENLHKFQGISVREVSAKELLEKQGLENVAWVPDPTLLIKASDYEKLLSNNQKLRVPFFLYILNNKSIFQSNVLTAMLTKQKKNFTFVGANRLYDKKINAFPTVQEWVGYMANAQTIITNSFHGCVFSIIFHKNFYYYPLLPNAKGYVDSRIDSLLTRLGIMDRAITTTEILSSVITNPYKPIDWDSVDAKREEFVQVGKDFLAKHLGDSSI